MSSNPGAAARAVEMPTEQAAISQLWAAYQRLIELGWRPPDDARRDREYVAVIAGCLSVRRVTCGIGAEPWHPPLPNMMPTYPIFIDDEARVPTDGVVLLVRSRAT